MLSFFRIAGILAPNHTITIAVLVAMCCSDILPTQALAATGADALMPQAKC